MQTKRNVRRVASLLGLGRAAIGLAALVAPAASMRGWAGDAVDTPGGTLLARAFGARDAALGLGVHFAARRGLPIKGWLRLSGLCDIADLAATSNGPVDELGEMATPSMGLAALGALSSFALAALADS